jgi:hypothetical protein
MPYLTTFGTFLVTLRTLPFGGQSRVTRLSYLESLCVGQLFGMPTPSDDIMAVSNLP